MGLTLMEHQQNIFILFDKKYGEEFRHNKRMEERKLKINKIRSKL